MKKLLLLLFLSFPLLTKAQIITTFAGNGIAGYGGDGGPATAAMLNQPADVFKDGSGNIYIADFGNNRIRKVNTSGVISTVAGNGVAGYTGDGGLAISASLYVPNGIAVDAAGNIYIADMGNHVIRMVNASGIISTIAGNGTSGFSGDGGLAVHAQLSDPTHVAVDLQGNIYISDSGNNHIRKVSTLGIISTCAGGGAADYTVDGVPATSLSLCNQMYVSVDNSGVVYIANRDCWHFLKITTDGRIYNVAGNKVAGYSGDCGPADSASLEYPYGICPDNLGNIYVCQRNNVRVRRVNTFNYITTVAGTGAPGYSGDGGPAVNAKLSAGINGIYADAAGNVYLADMANNVIRYFTAPAIMSQNNEICAGTTIVLNDSTGNWRSSDTSIAIVSPHSGVVTAIAAGTTVITCSNVSCQVFNVTVDTFPVLNFGHDTELCQGNVLLLSSGNIPSLWSTGATAPDIAVTDPGTYWAAVSNACSAVTDTINVNFDLCNFYFPSAFTPNDDGRNDIARAGGSLALYENYSLSIYNRWGQQVFYTQDVYDGWDGKCHGAKQEVGTYFYRISYTFEGTKKLIKGDLTLIR